MERIFFWGEKGCWYFDFLFFDDFLFIFVLYNMYFISENYININLIFNRYRYIYRIN